MLIVDKHLVIIINSQDDAGMLDMFCACATRYKRKDGTCRHQHAAMEMVKPEYKEAVRLVTAAS